MNTDIKGAIKDIVGAENFSDELMDLVSYSYDASPEGHRPDGAVWVRTTEQVSAVLKLANEHRIPVIPRGAGTSLSGMAVPLRGGIVVDMARMNRILKISVNDRLAVVQPGVVNQELQDALAPHGFMFPPDPASAKVATLGGNVAANAGGLKGAKYGNTKDYVLGLEVVLADGSVLRSGSECMKSVSGFDLTALFVGSEGTLGVITEITVKIHPKSRCVATCLATFDDLGEAGRAISETMTCGTIPMVLELLDEQCVRVLNQAAVLGLPEVAAMVLVEADGYTQEEADGVIARVTEIFQKNRASGIERATSAEDAEKLWIARKSIGGAVTRLNYNLLAVDITVPISRVPEVLIGAREIRKRYRLTMPILGHLGDGNLHPGIIFDGTDPEETARVKKAVTALLELGIKLGGTLSGEHGIGMEKAAFMSLEHDAVEMRVMNSLKKLFDPNNILNPGKMGLVE